MIKDMCSSLLGRPVVREESGDQEESEMEMATELLSMFFLLLLAISCGHYLKRSGHKYLQEAGLTTMIGMGAGYALKIMSIQSTLEKIT